MKIFSRRTADKQRTLRTDGHRTASRAPRWVGWFTDFGRPLSAIIVMVLCAPGERHLAELAGWGPNLSWGMAGLLVMYAGIAAVVATVRPKGAPGKKTAVAGAIVSLLLAMAAQPVSHYFVTGWMTADPRPPFWLVTVVSCVPPFVMGHLLHLAADPGEQADDRLPEKVAVPASAAPLESREDLAWGLGTPMTGESRTAAPVQSPEDDDDLSWDSAATWTPELAEDDGVTMPGVLREAMSGGHGQPVTHWNGQVMEPADALRTLQDGIARMTDSGRTDGHVLVREADGRVSVGVDPSGGRADSGRTNGQGETPDSTPDEQRTDSGRTNGQGETPDSTPDEQRTDSGRTNGQDMSAFIRDTWALNPDMDRAAMRAAVRRSFPDKKADAVRKAVARAEEASGS